MIVFVCTFLLLSGILGPRIISGGIVSRDHFSVYGTLGKIVLFAIIAFLLLARRRTMMKLPRWTLHHLWWFGASALTAGLSWWMITWLLNGYTGWWVIGVHVSLIMSVAFAFLGSFGLGECKKLIAYYWREIVIGLGAALGFYILLEGIYSLWGILATVVLHAVKVLLDVSGITAVIVQPRTLLLDKFGATVEQYCSGIESLALFSGLYAIVGFLDWPKLNHRKFLFAFPAALLGLFICNIIRVYVLILGGYFINPQIAFSLFHTYAGMLFFILYAAIFWKVSYLWMLRKN